MNVYVFSFPTDLVVTGNFFRNHALTEKTLNNS